MNDEKPRGKLPAVFVDAVVKHPVVSLVMSCLLLLALAVGLPRLEFSNDIRVFFSPENPDLQAYEAMEQTYSKSTNVLLVVTPRDPAATLFTADSLAGLVRLTEEAWRIPYSRRVDSLTNFQHSYAEGGDLVVEDLVPHQVVDLAGDDIARIRDIALSDPMLVNYLLSPDGRVAGINVPINLPGERPLQEQPEVAAFVRELARQAEADFPHLRVRLTGIVMINQELAEAAGRDFLTLVPLMFLFILVALGVLLRSVVAPLSAFAVIVLANVAAFGVAGWLGIVLSPPVISAVNMIMTLAVADAVHILVGFRSEYRGGVTRPEAMRRSLNANFRAVFLTTLTTVLGFLSLNTSDSPPFRDLGNIVAVGVIFAWLFAHTVLGPLLVLLPVRSLPAETRPGAMTRLLDGVALFGLRRPRLVLGTGTVLVVVMSLFIFRNELNDEFVKYFDAKSEFREATDFTIDRLTGFEYIEYAIDSGTPGGIADPVYLAKLDALASWFREQPRVRHVYAHSDIIKRLHKNLNEDAPEAYQIPEDRAIATDCLTIYEMSLPFGLDLTDRVNLDKSATKLRVSLSNVSSNEMIDLDRRAAAWMREHDLSAGTGGTGQSLMFAHIGLRNIFGLLGGTVLALVLISACMVVITRSWKFGLLSLLPNLAPAAIGFGIWGIFVGQVGLAISVVVGMTLGIVVDDTIHFMTKYLDYRRRKGLIPADAICQTVAHVGGAMVTSTVTLVGGFGVLAFSSFELNRGMGLLSAVIIAVALFFDLLFLPVLMRLIDRERQPIPLIEVDATPEPSVPVQI